MHYLLGTQTHIFLAQNVGLEVKVLSAQIFATSSRRSKVARVSSLDRTPKRHAHGHASEATAHRSPQHTGMRQRTPSSTHYHCPICRCLQPREAYNSPQRPQTFLLVDHELHTRREPSPAPRAHARPSGRLRVGCVSCSGHLHELTANGQRHSHGREASHVEGQQHEHPGGEG